MLDLDKLENWAYRPDVQEHLAKILHHPDDDHQDAVRELLPGGLRDVHAYSLWRLSSVVKLGDGSFQSSLTGNVGVALHTWLFHFLGGASAGLLPPPAANDQDGVAWSNVLRGKCKHAGKQYSKEIERLEKCVKRGSETAEALQAHRDRRVRKDWLHPPNTTAKQKRAGGAAAIAQAAAAQSTAVCGKRIAAEPPSSPLPSMHRRQSHRHLPQPRRRHPRRKCRRQLRHWQQRHRRLRHRHRRPLWHR